MGLIANKHNMEKSTRGKLNSIDWGKIGKGALVAVGGVLLTYGQDVFLNIDFGTYQGLAVAVNGIIVNFLRKLLTK